MLFKCTSHLIFDSVASVQGVNSHCAHAMVLECIYEELMLDWYGNPMIDSFGHAQYIRSFKFKNTDKNNKEIEIRAGI